MKIKPFMKQISILLIALSFAISSNASDEIVFTKNMTWAQVKAKALKEKKMIFFDAYASWCGPCKYMDQSVYTAKEVANYFNANYINVKMDMEEGEGLRLAEEFDVTAYPTFLFFSPEGKLLHKYIGGLEALDFIQLGKDAKEPSKQYFTLKLKAKTGNLNDTDFSTWAALANELEDADAEDILNEYYKIKTDILANKDVAATAILYTKNLTDKQLAYLYASKAKISSLLQWDEEKTNETLYGILFSKAVAAYENNNNSIESFSAIIKKFDPASDNYARKDIAFKIALLIDKDASKAVDLLINYLKDIQKPVAIDAIGHWLIDYSSRFDKEDIKKFATQLDLFKIRSVDKGKEYWYDLLQVLCNINKGDEVKAKEYAQKAYKHPKLPDEYKAILKESYNL